MTLEEALKKIEDLDKLVISGMAVVEAESALSSMLIGQTQRVQKVYLDWSDRTNITAETQELLVDLRNAFDGER